MLAHFHVGLEATASVKRSQQVLLGISSTEWLGLTLQNSYHFNRDFFGDMCVHRVMHHHSIEASFDCLNQAGVPFYRDVGLVRYHSIGIVVLVGVTVLGLSITIL